MNIFGIVGDAALIAWFPTVGIIGHKFSQRIKRAMAAHRANNPIILLPMEVPDAVAPAPIHVHILDLQRSEINITDAGGIHARCAIAGCQDAVYVAPNLAEMYVAETVRVR